MEFVDNWNILFKILVFCEGYLIFYMIKDLSLVMVKVVCRKI